MGTTIAAFDRIAENYDTLWTDSAIGQSQRAAVWCAIDPLFRAGQRVLDFGCGTGADALHLESRGVRIVAVDGSPGMVRQARTKGIPAQCISLEHLFEMGYRFDGAISNFGVLNCTDDLRSVARQFARLIRSGGQLAICVMGSCCVWEFAYFLGKWQPLRARRRLLRSGVRSSLGLDVYYPRHSELVSSFSEQFCLRNWRGIGLFVPPSYVTGLSSAAVRVLATVDKCVAHSPGLRALADHRLYLFERL